MSRLCLTFLLRAVFYDRFQALVTPALRKNDGIGILAEFPNVRGQASQDQPAKALRQRHRKELTRVKSDRDDREVVAIGDVLIGLLRGDALGVFRGDQAGDEVPHLLNALDHFRIGGLRERVDALIKPFDRTPAFVLFCWVHLAPPLYTRDIVHGIALRY